MRATTGLLGGWHATFHMSLASEFSGEGAIVARPCFSYAEAWNSLHPLMHGITKCNTYLRLASMFYQIFIFSTNDSSSKAMKKLFLFHLKSPFRS